MSDHRYCFKNTAFDAFEMRRRREEERVQIRKRKREEQLTKRRNIENRDMENGVQGAELAEIVDQLTNPPQMFAMSNDECFRSNQAKVRKSYLLQKNVIHEQLCSDIEKEQFEGVHNFRSFFRQFVQFDLEGLLDKEIVGRLVLLLKNSCNAMLQLEVLTILAKMPTGTLEETQLIVETGAVPLFIQLLSSPNEQAQEKAALALGNIPSDFADYREYLISCGIIEPLLQLLRTAQRSRILKNAVWTFSSICSGAHSSAYFPKIAEALPLLARLLDHTDPDIISGACCTLSNISDGSVAAVQAVINAGVCERLVQLLIHSKLFVVSGALRTIRIITSGEEIQKEVVLNCNVLYFIRQLMKTSVKMLQEECCCTILHIVMGNQHQIQSVIDAGIFPIILEIINTAGFRPKRKGVWALTKAISGANDAQIKYLVQIGCIPSLCNVLSTFDSNLLLLILHALKNVLVAGENLAVIPNPYAVAIEDSGGLEKIERLQGHDNSDVCNEANLLLQQYFVDDDVEEIEDGITDVVMLP